MSAILKMLEAADKATPGPWHSHNGRIYADDGEQHLADFWQGDTGKQSAYGNAAFSRVARNSTADIQRLVSWVERQGEAIHGIDSDGDYCRAGQYDRTIDADGKLGEYTCTCGLDEIQSLLRS